MQQQGVDCKGEGTRPHGAANCGEWMLHENRIPIHYSKRYAFWGGQGSSSPHPHRGKVEIPTDGGFALVNRACAGSDGFTQEVPGAGPIVRLRKGCINTS